MAAGREAGAGRRGQPGGRNRPVGEKEREGRREEEEENIIVRLLIGFVIYEKPKKFNAPLVFHIVPTITCMAYCHITCMAYFHIACMAYFHVTKVHRSYN